MRAFTCANPSSLLLHADHNNQDACHVLWQSEACENWGSNAIASCAILSTSQSNPNRMLSPVHDDIGVAPLVDYLQGCIAVWQGVAIG